MTGAGWHSRIEWSGLPGGNPLHKHDPNGLRLQHLRITGPRGTVTVRQTGSTVGRVDYDNVYAAVHDSAEPGGILFDHLPPETIVTGDHLDGRVEIHGSEGAFILPRFLASRQFIVSGVTDNEQKPRGLIGASTLVSCCAAPQLKIHDDRDVVISDWYTEQGPSIFYIAGNNRAGGRVTLDFSKAESESPVVGILEDYKGELAIVGGMFGHARDKRARRIDTTGASQPRVSFLASMFWHDALTGLKQANIDEAVGGIIQDRTRPDAVIPEWMDGKGDGPLGHGLLNLGRLGHIETWIKYCER